MLGGIAMLLCLSLDAVLHRQRWLTPEVLLGTAVYGDAAIWHGTARVALAGAGLQLVAAGLAGAICGLAFAWIRGGGLAAGLAFAVSWHFFWYFLLLPKLAPLAASHASRDSAIASHLLFGLALSRIPSFHRNLEPAVEAPFAARPLAPPPDAA